MKRSRPRAFFARWAVPTALLAALLAALIVGCASNDPFDPATAPNAKPQIQLFAAPVDTSRDLSPTSYNERTFYWSGTDKDGWIVDYYVSIRTDWAVEAPWDTTQRTDTTMSFVTDENGEARAILHLACRDNRGAYSDTLVRLIPLKNFPPVVNFEQDFDPNFNLQREITAGGDTIYWNWGPSSFRCFAFDPDGSATMDDYYQYTLAQVEPDTGNWVLESDPGADPETQWIRAEFTDPDEEVHHFEIFLPRVAPGSRTLTVSLQDEGDADARFTYDWDVHEPRGEPGSRVLFVKEGAEVPVVFQAALDSTYGVDGWNLFHFWAQFPDKPQVLIENFRLFDLVIWGNSGGASPNLEKATEKSLALAPRSILGRYVNIDGVIADEREGRLLMFSPALTGYATTLDATFIQQVLGINVLSAGTASLAIPAYKQLLGLEPHLLPMTSRYVYGGLKAISLEGLPGVAEPIYQMEFCRGCYGSRSAPADPYLATRRPLRSSGRSAQVVAMGFTPEHFSVADSVATGNEPAVAALRALLEQELEVAP